MSDSDAGRHRAASVAKWSASGYRLGSLIAKGAIRVH
jgi:hypothetical protein